MKTLKQFYIEMQAWIDAGCPEHEAFRDYRALCSALTHWTESSSLVDEIISSFAAAGLSPNYPFNSSLRDFENENDHNKIYQNPARLAWIKEHAA